MSASADPLLRLEGIKKIFLTDEVETVALAGIHLEVSRGEYVSIGGPSGCGKSTLLSIVGLLDSPTEGYYSLNDQPVSNLSPAERARIRNREVGFIFQSFNLIGDLTVFENVELPLTYRGMSGGETKTTHSRSAREGRHGPPDEALPGTALRWSTAARRRRASSGRQTLDLAGGRTNRQSRLQERRGCNATFERSAPGRSNHLHGHARSPLHPACPEEHRLVRWFGGRG